MCKVGDIILVNNYHHNNNCINKHSFVVLSIEEGQIQGLEYNLICNVMSSFKNQEQRVQKLNYPGNIEILNSDKIVINGNIKDGYIKAEQFYYFDKEKLDYKVIGSVTIEFFSSLIKFIEDLDIPIENVIDNL